MLEIKRNDLIITPNGQLDASAGSYDVPVTLINDDTYSDYTINMYVGWYARSILKKRKAEIDSDGNYLIPKEAFQQTGMIYISFLLEKIDKSQGLMTNALSYQVKNAPNVIIEVPADPTWEEIVREWCAELINATIPIISVSKKDGVTTLNITDINGTKTVLIEDGYIPVKGVDYTDGISPIVSVTPITEGSGGYKISITDANGTKTIDILNGSDGSDANVTDENIKKALGFTPANQEDVNELSREIVDLSVFVTPQMFGATGDGTTDDTKALQDAFNYVAKNGSYLFIPKGRYKVTSPIRVDWSSTSSTKRNFLQKIIGAGSQAFEKYYDNSVIVGYNIPAYRGVIELIGNGNTWGTETRIEDLGIECDESSCDPMSFALMYGDARNFKLSRVKLRGYNGIFARCGSIVDESGNSITKGYEQMDIKFEQCDIYTFPNNTKGFAFLPEGVITEHYATMDNIVVDSCLINGVWVINSVNVLFQSCHIAINNVASKDITTNNVGLLNGYEIDYATGFYVAQAMSCVFQNCYFEDYRRGIQITPTLGNIRNVSIMNCYLNPGCNQSNEDGSRLCADYGIRINPGMSGKVVRNVLVQNNVFRLVDGDTEFVIANVSNEFANRFVFRDNCTTSTQVVPKVINTTDDGFDICNDVHEGSSIKNMSSSTDGRELTIELTNGRSYSIKSATPIKGVDYFTEAEIEEITENASTLAKAELQQIEPPTWVEEVADMTDTKKHYVLLETGNIWAYMKKRKTIAGETVPAFTNLMDDPNAYIKNGYRYSLSGGNFQPCATDCAIVIPLSFIGKCTIRVRGAKMDGCAYGTSVYLGTTNTSFTTTSQTSRVNSTDANGDLVIAFETSEAMNGGCKYAVFNVASGVDVGNLIVTLNEEITYKTTDGGTEIVEEWTDTKYNIIK